MLAQPVPRQVTLPAGEGSVTLSLTTLDDAAPGPDSTVTATVTTGRGYTLGAGMASASVLVTDADQPLPVVTIAAATSEVTEGEPVQFTVSADRPPAAGLTVNVAVSESRSRSMLSGAPPGSVTLRAGAGSAALTVHTDADSVAEDDSTVTAALQPGTGYQIGDPGSAGVRVVDNDRAPGCR